MMRALVHSMFTVCILQKWLKLFPLYLLVLATTACTTVPDSPGPAQTQPHKVKDTSTTQHDTETTPSQHRDKIPSPPRDSSHEQTIGEDTLPDTETDLHVMAVGDIMPGTDYPKNLLPPNNGRDLLAGVTEVLLGADVLFGNFEGTLLSGGKAEKRCRNPSRCYVFRTPPSYVENLVAAGFDVMSLANNHARDFGEQGRSTTMQILAAAGIQHSGRIGDVARWRVRGLQIALIAFAPFAGSNNPLGLEEAALTVKKLKAENDLVLVSMHMGAEGVKAIRIPFAQEWFYGENRGDVVRFSHAMVDAGADLVLGHGPHVPRAIELYKQRLIAYSLGNFCTYLGFNVRGKNGLAPILSVKLRPNGEFSSGEIISAVQIEPGRPVLDPKHQAARLINKLTLADFPHTPLEISPKGQIKIIMRSPEQQGKLLNQSRE